MRIPFKLLLGRKAARSRKRAFLARESRGVDRVGRGDDLMSQTFPPYRDRAARSAMRLFAAYVMPGL